MATTSTKILTLILFAAFAAVVSSKPTPYEALEGFNFPAGLLPKGALDYDLEVASGKFSAYLKGSCSFALEGSYQLSYKSKISGIISQNKLTSLTGVSVKVFFVWLNIVEIRRSGDDLEFSVGIASASFPIDNFFECPQCGCGLDCVGADGGADSRKMMKIKVKDNAALFCIARLSSRKWRCKVAIKEENLTLNRSL
ncbi:hypothetical protein V2J09_016077 [Rumex salicifolius]